MFGTPLLVVEFRLALQRKTAVEFLNQFQELRDRAVNKVKKTGSLGPYPTWTPRTSFGRSRLFTV